VASIKVAVLNMTRILRILFVASTLGAGVAAIAAQPAVDALGPQVGEQAPEFSGVDQFGRTQTLRSVVGAKGAMLVFFRSADW
jgi:hypothetical protein